MSGLLNNGIVISSGQTGISTILVAVEQVDPVLPESVVRKP